MVKFLKQLKILVSTLYNAAKCKLHMLVLNKKILF